MGPETNIDYSDEDTEPVEYSEDGEDVDDDDNDVDESTQVNEAKRIMKNNGYRVLKEKEVNLDNLVKNIFELLTAYDIEASDNEVKKLVWNYIDSGRDVEHASAEDVIELDLDNEPDSVLKYNGGIHFRIKEGKYNDYFDESTKVNEGLFDRNKTGNDLNPEFVKDFTNVAVDDRKKIISILLESGISERELKKAGFQEDEDLGDFWNDVAYCLGFQVTNGCEVKNGVLVISGRKCKTALDAYKTIVHTCQVRDIAESTQVNECGVGCYGGKKKKDKKKKKKDIDEVYDIVNELQLKTLIDESEADVTFIYDESVDNIVDSEAYSDLCEALDTLDEIDYEVDDQDPSCLAVWRK